MDSVLLARLMALAPRALDGLLAVAPDACGPVLQVQEPDRDAAGLAVIEDGIAVVPVPGPLLRCDWLTALLGARIAASSGTRWSPPSPILPR